MFPVRMKISNFDFDMIKEAGFASPSPLSESSCLTDSWMSQSDYNFCSWPKFGGMKHPGWTKEESSSQAPKKSVSSGSKNDLEVDSTGYVLALEAQSNLMKTSQINLMNTSKRKSARQPTHISKRRARNQLEIMFGCGSEQVKHAAVCPEEAEITSNLTSAAVRRESRGVSQVTDHHLEAYFATITRSSPHDQCPQHQIKEGANELLEDKFSCLRVEDLVEKSNKYAMAQITGDIPIDPLSFLAECLINEYVLALMKGEMVVDPLPLLEECLIGSSLPLPLASLSTTEPQNQF